MNQKRENAHYITLAEENITYEICDMIYIIS